MSWMQRLYETYEQAMDGNDMGDNYPMPISHTVQNTHICVVIDGQGNFKRAKVLEKTQIILPATEKSAGRSSGEAPHALADKIQYVAGDYAKFGGLKSYYFNSYQAQLREWLESEFALPSIKAIYAYISKKTLVADLLQEKVLWAKDNVLLTEWDDPAQEQPPLFKVLPKEKGKLDQGSALVCWAVESEEVLYTKTWEDPELRKSWIAFDAQQGGNQSLCYISGKEETLAVNHPAKLRHSGDKAKLISANDLSGYTFKGRFTDNNKSIQLSGLQAASIGLLTTQKAHNALRWLINRQGIRNGDQVIVVWAASGKPTPSIIDEKVPKTNWFVLDDEAMATTVEYQEEPESQPDLRVDLGKRYAERVKQYMRGYRDAEGLTANDIISIMAIDSATPGRMAVTYYQEKMPDDYLDDITAWHIDFAWPQLVRIGNETNKEKIWLLSPPLVKNIARCAYGKNVDDTLRKNLVERLLPCIVNRKNLPKDILSLCIKSSCNPLCKRKDGKFSTRLSEREAWLDDIAITCALYKGFHSRENNINIKKEYSMSLEQDNTSRDYLHGRLLAVAEKIESVTLSMMNESRLTNAERLFQRFSMMPSTTWLNIENAIKPYQQKLNAKNPWLDTAYKALIDDISYKFKEGEGALDDKLSGEFLLGYHCQRKWLDDHRLEKSKWVLKVSNTASEQQTINDQG